MRELSFEHIDIASEIRRVACLRGQPELATFDALAYRHAVLVQALLDSVGAHPRAPRWKCTNQPALVDQPPYDTLADSDEHSVLNLLSLAACVDASRRPELDNA